MYVDLVDDINRDIASIVDKMAQLKKTHNDRLMGVFDDESAQEHQIDILTREVTRHFNSAGVRLKRVASKRKANSVEDKIKQNIQRALASKLQSLSQEFRAMQKQYLGQLKQYKDGGSLDIITGASSTPTGASESKAGDIDMGFSDSQMQHLMSAEELAQERDQEIVHIAKSIEELAAIFKELATLVIDQGTIIDRIDYNMEMAVQRTQAGLGQLHKAEEYQKSSRPLKCIILLLVLIAIMVIILLTKK